MELGSALTYHFSQRIIYSPRTTKQETGFWPNEFARRVITRPASPILADAPNGQPRRDHAIIPNDQGNIRAGLRPEIAKAHCFKIGDKTKGLIGGHEADPQDVVVLGEVDQVLAREAINPAGEAALDGGLANNDVDELDGERQMFASCAELVSHAGSNITLRRAV